jgi:DNA-directed RNA polymerase specialized sigma24 family protein
METILRTDETGPFAGCALVYGNPVYVDTVSGIGTAEVLEKMAAFLDGFARWRHTDPMFGTADMRQEAYAAALEGMRVYRHGHSAQLSTFLHLYVRNRMIDIRRGRQMIRVDLSDIPIPQTIDPEDAMDLVRGIEALGERWGRIARRIFVEGERIGDVARDEQMSPWGLTRALRKRTDFVRRQRRQNSRPTGKP